MSKLLNIFKSSPYSSIKWDNYFEIYETILKKFINNKNKLRSKPGIIWCRDWVDTRIKIKFYQTWVNIIIPNQNSCNSSNFCRRICYYEKVT